MTYTFENIKEKKNINIYVITLSDRASKGIYEDTSGKEILNRFKTDFEEKGWKLTINYKVIPDNEKELTNLFLKARNEKADFFFTSGGTGIGPRDITVDTLKPFVNKELPGIMELIRVKYGLKFPHAVLSRGIAGFSGNTQVYTLPGSRKAISDYMDEILKTSEHLIYMYYGIDVHKK